MLEIGSSTKADAIDLYGSPKADYRNGSQLLYEVVGGTPAILPEGLMRLAFLDVTSHKYLFLEFNDAGVLKDVTFEKSGFPGAGPVRIKELFSDAFSRDVTDILGADVAWVRMEAGCDTESVWSYSSSWDKPVVCVQGIDFVGFARWRDDGRFDVVWTSDHTDIVRVSLDAWGRNRCVVLHTKSTPAVTFTLPSENPWFMVDPGRTELAFAELAERTKH